MFLGAHLRRRQIVSSISPRLVTSACWRFASRLSFQEIDAKWQQRWAEAPSRPGRNKKFYVLPMFAYPSGTLHMGHLRVYTISDVIARYRVLKGYSVLHPTGWDAFGLPAENAAIERGIDPAAWTEDNIQKMKVQLKSMNTRFDWDAEISTCSPSFYKHTQRLFLMLHRKGLAYQAEAVVNYDPVDKTVLANEQVDANGRSWRSGALVQQLSLRQWFFRIKTFQEDLLKDLESLAKNNRWPERVLAQQQNWLGKSQGARIRFGLSGAEADEPPVDVFTTRPDTLFGVVYIALSLSHPLVKKMVTKLPVLEDWLISKASVSPDSKAGFELPIKAINPCSSDTIPIFAAPYVLGDYGEGAVMGVPAHDARDLAFWKVHRPETSIPLAVRAQDSPTQPLHIPTTQLNEAFVARGVLSDLCGKYAGMDSSAGAEQIVADLATNGQAEFQQTWRLRDWLVSRQRYWGTPIPIIHCDECGVVPVPEDELPVLLPVLPKSLEGHVGNALDQISSWVNCSCPNCDKPARRETDTMDTFVDSSWYYARFTDPRNENELFSKGAADAALPVDTYVGGVEHAILHLLYARFIYKFLCSEGLISRHESEREPFQYLIAQGMVHGKTFSDPATARFLKPQEVDHTGAEPVMIASGAKATVTWEKMSKSKHNGTAPSPCIEKYGADATRAHMLFAAPVSEVLQWDTEKITGIQRWFGRIQRLCSHLSQSYGKLEFFELRFEPSDVDGATQQEAELLLLAHDTIRNVTRIFESDPYSLNTAVSDLMKLTNALQDAMTENRDFSAAALSSLLRMLAPIAPAFAEQCWEEADLHPTQRKASIFETSWPAKLLTSEAESVLRSKQNIITCAVHVNGKLKFTIDLPAPDHESPTESGSAREQRVLEAVLATEQGKLWLTQKNDWEKRRKVIVRREGKLLNVVY